MIHRVPGLLVALILVLSACSGNDAASPPVSEEVSSTTTTLAPAIFSQLEIERALPQGMDLTAGWSMWGGIEAGFSGASETGGFCDGPSQVQRGLSSDATGYAALSLQSGDRPSASFGLGVYAFPNAIAAEKFVRISSDAAASCGSFETKALETEVDGLLEGNEDTEWKILMNFSIGAGYAIEADLSGLITEGSKYSAQVDGFQLSFEETTFVQYDVYGTVVIVTSVSQRSAFAGYSDSGAGPELAVLTARDLELLNPIKESVLSSLAPSKI
jgi:hypothetical protein